MRVSPLPEHIEVLQTLYRAGLLSIHAKQSIRGQLMYMPHDEAELYLKKLIKRKGETNHAEQK